MHRKSRGRGALLVDLVLALAVLALVLVPLFLELHRALGRERASLTRLRLHGELARLRAALPDALDAVELAPPWRELEGCRRARYRLRREPGEEIEVILIEIREGTIDVVRRVPVCRPR